MPSLPTFTDFMATTGPAYLTSANEVINEAAKHNYNFSKLLRGKSADQVIQGGSSIRDTILIDDGSGYRHYSPNEAISYQLKNHTRTIEVPWRFTLGDMTWTDHEIELNLGGSPSADSAKVTYKRLKRIKEQACWTGIFNGMEADLFAPPTVAGMEASDGKDPYSLAAFITEIDAFFSSLNEWRGTLPLGFTTIAGVNPLSGNSNRYTNQVSLYDPAFGVANVNADPADVVVNSATAIHSDGTTTGIRQVHPLFSAMDDMWQRVKYDAPEMKSEFFTKPELNRQLIITDREGQNMYKRLLRASNDRLTPKSDPEYNAPLYSGIPVSYAADLDNAAIFPAVTAGTAVANTLAGRNAVAASAASMIGTSRGASTVDKGPRFFFVNGAFIGPRMHSKRFLRMMSPMNTKEQPFSWAQVVDSWWNLFASSRQRLGIVAPMARA